MQFCFFDAAFVRSQVPKLLVASLLLIGYSSAMNAIHISLMADQAAFISKLSCKQLMQKGALGALCSLALGIGAKYCWKKAEQAYNELGRDQSRQDAIMAKDRFEGWSALFATSALGSGWFGIMSIAYIARAYRLALRKKAK